MTEIQEKLLLYMNEMCIIFILWWENAHYGKMGQDCPTLHLMALFIPMFSYLFLILFLKAAGSSLICFFLPNCGVWCIGKGRQWCVDWGFQKQKLELSFFIFKRGIVLVNQLTLRQKAFGTCPVIEINSSNLTIQNFSFLIRKTVHYSTINL